MTKRPEPLALEDRTVGEVVSQDYTRAAVFGRLGIDFCCGGARTVGDACRRVGRSVEELERELAEADRSSRGGPLADPRFWDPDLLADYIVRIHHRYVRETLPVLIRFSEKVARVHGGGRPELPAIRDLVAALSVELEDHMHDEESVLFPRLSGLVAARRAGTATVDRENGLSETLAALEHDHDEAGARMRRIRELSEDFTAPEGACATYRATFAKLREFEEDLHLHVHLENNVLFPAVAELLREPGVAREA